MSSNITKETLNDILKDLGKEYRKHNRYTPAEIVMTGGAAILANYGFRNMSNDIDAIIKASSALKDAAIIVGEKYNLAKDWLNSDFRNTTSYSEKLYEHSKYYRMFSNILTVRIVEPEYLLATKLKAARGYKHDLSDIVGIISEERLNNPSFTKENVLKAYYEMYGKDDKINENAFMIFNEAFDTKDIEELYNRLCKSEQHLNQLVHNFQNQNPGVLNADNLNDILLSLQEKEDEIIERDDD